MTLHLVVPATLSNLGSGFDVLGLALSLSNQFTFAVDGPAGSLTERGERLDPETHGVAGALRAAERAFGAVVFF